MEKQMIALLLLALVCSPASGFLLTPTKVQPIGMQAIQQPIKGPSPNIDWCSTCVNIMDQILQQLIDIVANVGVIGSCGALCALLPEKLEQVACDLLCDYIGIELFIDLLKKIDLDPIFYCELAKLCPIHDGGAAKITSWTVTPPKGPQGGTFEFELVFQVLNETGTGEIEIQIVPPDAMPFGDAVVNDGFKPGMYGVKFSLQAQPSEQEPFDPGTYKALTAVCYGQCGSKHPHSAILGEANTTFAITG